MSKQRPTAVLWAESISRSVFRWLEEYLLEWQLTDARNTRKLHARIDALTQAVNHSDVVCFVKPGGLCPFCNLASRLLLETASAKEKPPFTLHIADLFNEDREALRMMLDVPVLTWPAVFIRGVHLPGGGEAVARLHKAGELVGRIGAARAEFAPTLVEPPVHPRPLLFHQAGGGSWRGCQTRIYGNVLRGIAVLQIALLLPAHELTQRGHPALAIPLLLLLAVDALLFCLAGPTPWSPLGNLATLVVWRRRGAVAPLGPYKVTVGGLYLLMNVAGVICRLPPSTATSGAIVVANTSAVSVDGDPLVCALINSDGLVWSMVTNSCFLAIFRF